MLLLWLCARSASKHHITNCLFDRNGNNIYNRQLLIELYFEQLFCFKTCNAAYNVHNELLERQTMSRSDNCHNSSSTFVIVAFFNCLIQKLCGMPMCRVTVLVIESRSATIFCSIALSSIVIYSYGHLKHFHCLINNIVMYAFENNALDSSL